MSPNQGRYRPWPAARALEGVQAKMQVCRQLCDCRDRCSCALEALATEPASCASIGYETWCALPHTLELTLALQTGQSLMAFSACLPKRSDTEPFLPNKGA